MHKVLDPGTVRLHGDALGAFDVHHVKSLCSAFGIETDCVHHAVHARHRVGHRLCLPDIGANGLETRITGPEQRLSPIGVPRRNPHGIPSCMQRANDAPAKKPRSTEHSDDAWAHLILRGQYLQQMPIGIFEVEPASSTSVVDRHVVR